MRSCRRNSHGFLARGEYVSCWNLIACECGLDVLRRDRTRQGYPPREPAAAVTSASPARSDKGERTGDPDRPDRSGLSDCRGAGAQGITVPKGVDHPHLCSQWNITCAGEMANILPIAQLGKCPRKSEENRHDNARDQYIAKLSAERRIGLRQRDVDRECPSNKTVNQM